MVSLGIGTRNTFYKHTDAIPLSHLHILCLIAHRLAEKFLGLLSIKEPIAKGIAIGCSAHALGTAKAMEMGTIEGAMSSLSIVVCGVMTVVGASIFALFM